MWFFIGLIEKLYIFKRREDPKLESKICDHCKASNGLRFWYCTECGYPLQLAAPIQKIFITPYRGIERLVNSAKFLSWLFGVAGVIITPVLFLIFLFQDVFLAILSVVIAILFSYMMVVAFKFIADMLDAVIKITNNLSVQKRQ